MEHLLPKMRNLVTYKVDAAVITVDGGKVAILSNKTVADAVLEQLKTEDGVSILLSHRPELFESYRASGMDLVLSGHAHGGQFRLPFIGGLIAPNQGFFPQYDSGLYTDETTNMIVSRGIGNSLFPFRFNNRPEVILIELQTA